MIRLISGIHVDPIQRTPVVSQPNSRLETLQRHDVFFSDQSWKAQLKRFASQKPLRTMMFRFSKQEQRSFWDKIAPPRQSIILLTPICPEKRP